jgi:two-component system chemotaxis response regulator CheB
VEALENGAVEVLGKPDGPYSVGALRQTLSAKIRAAASSKVRRTDDERPALAVKPPRPPAQDVCLSRVCMIAIGASTGGTEALQEVLTHLPAACPPIVIVQHIPAVFSKAFAERLNGLCALQVKEAQAGDRLACGSASIAPGGYHMLVRRDSQGYFVDLDNRLDPVCYQRPAVDVLFRSVAELAGCASIGVILTGMGSDGAEGLSAMKKSGSRTMAQDEASCVVYGMPREAVRLGAVDAVVPLKDIASRLMSWL